MTDFGKALRQLRLMRGELLMDMAGKVGVSSAFLSGVENGKKSVPPSLVDRIITVYNLTPREAQELRLAVDRSAKQVQISLAHVDAEKRDMAFAFARSFEMMDPEQVEKILRILNAQKKGGTRPV